MPLPYQFTFFASGVQLSLQHSSHTHYTFIPIPDRGIARIASPPNTQISPPKQNPRIDIPPHGSCHSRTDDVSRLHHGVRCHQGRDSRGRRIHARGSPRSTSREIIERHRQCDIRMASPLPTMPDWIPSVDDDSTALPPRRRCRRHEIISSAARYANITAANNTARVGSKTTRWLPVNNVPRQRIGMHPRR